MRTGILRRARRALERRGDEGAALVTVVGLALVIAVVLVTIATSTLFNIRTTVLQRGTVQAQARAEAGVDGFAAWLAAIDPAVGCVGGAPLSGSGYSVSGVTYYNASGAVVPSANSCPPNGATAVELRSVGTVPSPTADGTTSSSRTMSARIELGATTTPSPLNAAVFSQSNLTIAKVLNVMGGAAGAGDIYTNGSFDCSNDGTVSGTLFAKGSVDLNACDFLEDVVAYGGDFECDTTAKINGDLYAAGAVKLSSTPCTIGGDVYANGKFTCSNPSQIGGLVSALGDLEFSSGCQIAGATYASGNMNCGGGLAAHDMYVGGTVKLSSSACKITGLLHAGGTVTMPSGATVTGDLTSRAGNLELASAPVIGGTVRLGGKVTGSAAAAFVGSRPGTVLQNQAGLSAPSAPPSAPASLTTFPTAEFPQRKDDDAAWTRGHTVSWSTMLQPYLAQSWGNTCSYQASFTGTVVLNADTMYDAQSSCSGGSVSWNHGDASSNIMVNGNATIRARSFTVNSALTITLKGDLVIMADSITLANGGLKVVSGDGQKHNVYIVNPWSSATQCTASATASSTIRLQNSVTFDPVLSVLFYTPGSFTSSATTPGTNKLSFTGQVYGCSVGVSQEISMTYDSVGGSAPGAPGGMNPVVEWKRDG